MSDLEKLGGLEFAEAYANENDDLPATAFVIRPLIAKVKELERELSDERKQALQTAERNLVNATNVMKVTQQEMSSLDAKLQSARELAEMVKRGEWWSKIEAKATELLEGIK